MGGSASSVKQASDTAAEATMKNLYELTSMCEANQTQDQTQVVKMKDSFSLGISQNQMATSNLSCLSNNKLTQLFDSDFKNKIQSDLSNQISGVASLGLSKSDVASAISNKLFTENSIKSIQKAIDTIDQRQSQDIEMEGSITGKISQDQASSIIMSQVSSIASDAILQSKQEQEMKLSQSTVVTGTDITAIATTAIKTVGSVLTTFASAFMIGSIIFVIVIVVAVIGLIIFLKKNCVNIKNGITAVSKGLPIPTFQLKMIASAIGMFCPGDGKESTPSSASNESSKSPKQSFISKLMQKSK